MFQQAPQINNYSPSVQEVFQQMITGQINPKEFMINKINNLSPQEKTRFKSMMNNGMFKHLFRQFGVSDNQYNDFVSSIKI